ncbi:hypothetical protein AAY473_018942 [Plecturocebus cupreus]
MLKGLKQTRKKPINYATLSTERKKTQQLSLSDCKSFKKYLPLSPNSIKGQLIVKNKFITQSAANIKRKLRKLALRPELSLESLLNQATSVFYNKSQKEQAKKKPRKNQRKAPLVIAFTQAKPRGSDKGEAQVSPQSSKTCYQCGLKGHVIENCPQRKKPPPHPCPLCKEVTKKHTVPGNQGV